MIPIFNRSILISKVCNSDIIQTWSHINVHMDIMKCKVSPALHVDSHSITLSMSLSIWDITECGVLPNSM